MRVLLATYSTRPRGGVVHTLALAEALAAEGAEVTVATVARGGDAGFFRSVDPAVRVVVAPLPEIDGEDLGRRVVRSIAALRGAVDVEAYDVVHAQDCISANALDRCVRTVHHLDTFTTPQLVACHERAIVDPIAHICVSAAVAADLRAGWGIEATVIPNGVEAERFAAAVDDGEGRRAWRQKIGAPYVLAVGGIEPRKGTLDLIEAWPAIAAAHPEVRLVVAGGETLFDYRPYRAEVEARCAALRVEPLVLGPVEHDVLPSLVAEASVVAMPSTKEGFGLAAMEALAASTPVVLSRLPVFEEVFAGAATIAGPGPTGLEDALLRALSGPDPVHTAAGRALAGRHTWEAAASAHLTRYGALLA